MSLIVLNSKGEDAEDFQNYMTENIEFPANAEVCLVGSHINRKMLIAQEVQFSSQGNRMMFQYGSGDLNARTVGNSYTPHAPYFYEFSEKNQIFPVKYANPADVEAATNAYMNDKDNTPISPLVGGWQNDIPGTGLFEFHNLMFKPDPAQALGTLGNVVAVPGELYGNQGINSTETYDFNDVAITPLVGGGAFANWILVQARTGKATQFIDLNPLYNTDNGETVGTFTPLTGATANFDIEGGGWNWQITPAAAPEPRVVEEVRGGIVANGGELIDPTKGDLMNGINSNLNKLSNNTDFSVWWQLENVTVPGDPCDVVFYKRPVLPPGNKAYTNQMDGAIEWSRATIGVPQPEALRISIRPTLDVAGTGAYVLEAYCSLVSLGTFEIQGAIIPGVGTMKITDPLDFTEAPETKCNLYRHLPLRMGCTATFEIFTVGMKAIHHGDTNATLLGAANQNASLPFTFGMGGQTPLEARTNILDKDTYQMCERSTLGYALGYQSPFTRTAAAAMVPAPGTGARADLPLGQTIPLTHSLVVSLPDLPISGFFGNSTGTDAAGTLGINSGGTSAPIIGVIPFAPNNAPAREAAPIPGLNKDSRGSFYAAPMENWIKLKNPHAFKVSSLRVRLTDELGAKPNVCAGNTTITIKIKAPRVGDVDRGLTIQGN